MRAMTPTTAPREAKLTAKSLMQEPIERLFS
jgi:hypothetical protein